MKISKFLFFGALVCFNCIQLFSQTESNSLIKTFGIGLHLEQFKWNDVEELQASPANKIILAIAPVKSIRLEPEFGFRIGHDKTDEVKNKSTYFGLGTLGMIQRSKLNLYAGIRFEYARIKEEGSLAYDGSDFTARTNRYTIGPALGCEYFLGENFTFGGELGLRYSTLKTIAEYYSIENKTQENNYFGTETGLFIRFYF